MLAQCAGSNIETDNGSQAKEGLRFAKTMSFMKVSMSNISSFMRAPSFCNYIVGP